MILNRHRLLPRAQRGFTLIELLVVAAILVAVSFIAYSNYGNVVDEAKPKVAYAEMQEIAKALNRFKQDTGYYPKQGPFAFASVDPASWPSVVPTADRADWFASPANFWQLFECPRILSTNSQAWLGCSSTSAQSWNPSTGRGWRGPYLQRSGEGWVDVSSNLSSDGSGSPVPTSSTTVRVRGAADPFGRAPDRTVFPWRSVYSATADSDQDLGGLGGPYFVFGLNGSTKVRIVSMGLDGEYETYDTANDDLCEPKGDDIVLCLE